MESSPRPRLDMPPRTAHDLAHGSRIRPSTPCGVLRRRGAGPGCRVRGQLASCRQGGRGMFRAPLPRPRRRTACGVIGGRRWHWPWRLSLASGEQPGRRRRRSACISPTFANGLVAGRLPDAVAVEQPDELHQRERLGRGAVRQRLRRQARPDPLRRHAARWRPDDPAATSRFRPSSRTAPTTPAPAARAATGPSTTRSAARPPDARWRSRTSPGRTR